MKGILFLDIDDVIAHSKQYDAPRHRNEKWGSWYPFDRKSVAVLNEIIIVTDCDIVISSDWKRHYSIDQLIEIFEYNNVAKIPIDVTRNSSTQNKQVEINDYVKDHSLIKWVAIDDIDLGVKNFVHCKKYNEGIKQSGIKDKIISFLI